MSQSYKQPQHKDRDADATPAPQPAVQSEKLTDDVEAILDEIDDVLEVNAEEFVANYVQKGGQ